ncbi:fimbria/pilus periplasmic chaperone [Escherichia coli]|uniref:fimbria/pilus periplasmic chaperone n=1 Tax=Escherichia coli TaxID=562 RepID=UPI000DF2CC4C|nr:fimbria/pilus periplasmic chaperone [Escherichia coli]EFJ7371579.1 fimbria/pilus periplasmic chaperone [Escherichia coli]RCP65674.1 hypothetical protein A6574_14435 [Escherichia coli]CAD5789296.1 CS12 fimbria chaperone protein [Escherichia coli]CAD5791003.1 CS12 fimbria chaperone protein [Escherichia coli]CAD5792459.1 CS12 fimbria chaperone protein [Escherichia coli]
MIMGQLKNTWGLLNKLISITIIILSPRDGLAMPQPNGIAIDPIIIKAKYNKVSKFRIFNNTNSDYIITSKVLVEGGEYQETNTPFIVNPPIRLLKAKSDVLMGVINLDMQRNKCVSCKYYLSVTFAPQVEKKSMPLFVPVVMVQEIPIILSDSP